MNTLKLKLATLLFVVTACGAAQALAGIFTIAPLPEYTRSLNDMTDGGSYGNPGSFVDITGVPFTIADGAGGAFNIWSAFDVPGANPHVLNIPVNVFGVTTAYTVMNLFLGQTGFNNPVVEFFGTGGAYYTQTLVVGTDIRDHNNAVFSNTINGTSTIEIFSAGDVRLDRQAFDLPTIFETETLMSMRITDSGGNPEGRTFIAALTVQAVPEPGTLALLLGSFGIAGLIRRQRIRG